MISEDKKKLYKSLIKHIEEVDCDRWIIDGVFIYINEYGDRKTLKEVIEEYGTLDDFLINHIKSSGLDVEIEEAKRLFNIEAGTISIGNYRIYEMDKKNRTWILYEKKGLNSLEDIVMFMKKNPKAEVHVTSETYEWRNYTFEWNKSRSDLVLRENGTPFNMLYNLLNDDKNVTISVYMPSNKLKKVFKSKDELYEVLISCLEKSDITYIDEGNDKLNLSVAYKDNNETSLNELIYQGREKKAPWMVTRFIDDLICTYGDINDVRFSGEITKFLDIENNIIKYNNL